MQNALYTLGILAAVAAVVLAVVGANLNAAHLPQDVHPNASIGMAIAALAFLKAAERA